MNELYTLTTPTFVKILGGVRNNLDKVAAFASEKNIDPSVILNDRLAPDMFDLKRQVQIACDNAKGAVARLTLTENPSHEDVETTIPELQARIDKTIAFITSVPESAFEKAAEVKVEIKYFPGKYMVGAEYAHAYALPNFFFHSTIAYGIMRHNGVPLGKADFINGLPLKDL